MPVEPEFQLIEVKVQTLQQIFNSMDPSPFHERDLDREAEEFIISWAKEHSSRKPYKLIVHLGQGTDQPDAVRILSESIRNYFSYRAEMNRRELKQLLHYGWISLIIATLFLGLCVTVAQTVDPELGRFRPILREGLIILGWVAMWRPLDVYLYRWWPVHRLGRIYRGLSKMPIEIRTS
jgi:hypothetical protein